MLGARRHGDNVAGDDDGVVRAVIGGSNSQLSCVVEPPGLEGGPGGAQAGRHTHGHAGGVCYHHLIVAGVGELEAREADAAVRLVGQNHTVLEPSVGERRIAAGDHTQRGGATGATEDAAGLGGDCRRCGGGRPVQWREDQHEQCQS